ncbi:hypothetical protein ACQPYA_03955 [Micromonospora sp. CA-263727]|uniref:hypothetical protein n=1 Tax=Micromonospora sp. CA-263727 TaxID=3239967 RepID=UPI003D92575E
MVNFGTGPVDEASEAAAEANMSAFVDALRQRGIDLPATADRDPSADRDGRYGYLLPTATGAVHILMPGADLARVRDDLTASAPCLVVNGQAWWWHDATGQAAAAITTRQADVP